VLRFRNQLLLLVHRTCTTVVGTMRMVQEKEKEACLVRENSSIKGVLSLSRIIRVDEPRGQKKAGRQTKGEGLGEMEIHKKLGGR